MATRVDDKRNWFDCRSTADNIGAMAASPAIHIDTVLFVVNPIDDFMQELREAVLGKNILAQDTYESYRRQL